MVNYALDLENLRVVAAMQELGIVKEELILKNLEDFADPHISQEIQKLRYDHYNKMLKNAVTEIRELLKKKHITLIPGESKTTLLNLTEGSSSQKNLIDLKKTLYRKEHEVLKNTLSVFDIKSPKRTKKIAETQENFDYVEKKNYKDIFKKCKNKQEVNLRKIQGEQVKSQKMMGEKFSKSMKEHLNREMLNEKNKRLRAKLKEDEYQRKYEEIQQKKMMQEQMFEDAIALKLEKFQNKIQKSEEIHVEALQEKVGRTLKFQDQFEKVQSRLENLRKSNEVELLKKLVDKHEVVKQHRERTEEEIHKKLSKRKEIFDKKRNEAMERIKKVEQEFILKSRSTEKDYVKAQKNYSERIYKVNEEMMYRKELKRLKDLECLIKVQRAKRRFGNKNSKSLQKTLEKYSRIDEYKNARERQIYTARDSAIKAMIEKEKIQEAVAVIWKSPRSKTAQEKLKGLNWFPKEESVSGDEEKK